MNLRDVAVLKSRISFSLCHNLNEMISFIKLFCELHGLQEPVQINHIWYKIIIGVFICWHNMGTTNDRSCRNKLHLWSRFCMHTIQTQIPVLVLQGPCICIKWLDQCNRVQYSQVKRNTKCAKIAPVIVLVTTQSYRGHLKKQGLQWRRSVVKHQSSVDS